MGFLESVLNCMCFPSTIGVPVLPRQVDAKQAQCHRLVSHCNALERQKAALIAQVGPHTLYPTHASPSAPLHPALSNSRAL